MKNRGRNRNVEIVQIILFTILAIYFLINSIYSLSAWSTAAANPDKEAIITNKYKGEKYGRPYYFLDVDVDDQEYSIYVHNDLYKQLSVGESIQVRYTGNGYERFASVSTKAKSNIFIFIVTFGLDISVIAHRIKKHKKSAPDN